MRRSDYRTISEMVPNTYNPIDNPLTYCIDHTADQRFLHGGNADSYGQHSKPCQEYLSTYCSEKWDTHCEEASVNSKILPNNIEHLGITRGIPKQTLNAGDTLIYNTAAKKYLISMGNCSRKYEPFDPTVASSPLISYWVSKADSCKNGICDRSRPVGCDPVYGVSPVGLDDDVVMNKILSKPSIAMDILVNIYINMRNNGSLSSISGTKLGYYYNTAEPFSSSGGVKT